MSAIAEARRNLELIAKLTGELTPAMIEDRGPVTINVVRVPMPAPRPMNRALEASALPEPPWRLVLAGLITALRF